MSPPSPADLYDIVDWMDPSQRPSWSEGASADPHEGGARSESVGEGHARRSGRRRKSGSEAAAEHLFNQVGVQPGGGQLRAC